MFFIREYTTFLSIYFSHLSDFVLVAASNKSIGCFAGDNSTGNVLATATTKDDCKKTCLANGYPIYGIQGTFNSCLYCSAVFTPKTVLC